MRNAITQATQLNIGANVGIMMFAFMWVAAAAAIAAAITQMALCCCCASRRDVKKGKKRGSMKAYKGEYGNGSSDATTSEKQPGRFSALK